MGIFEENAPLYHKLGLNVVPVSGKRPICKDFNQYFERQVTDDEIDQWQKEFPNSNIGLVCGVINGILGFDYDYTGERCDELEKIIIDILPPSPAIKSSRPGKWTRFYKIDSDIKTRGYDFKFTIDKSKKQKSIRVYDVLSNGRQTVIPPSIHETTKKPYQWEGQQIIDVIDYLPTISQEILDIIWESTDLFFNSEKSSGRNSAIFAYACKCIHEHSSFGSWKKELEKYDVTKFSNNSYFNDPDERGNKSKDEFLDSMAKSWFKSIVKIKKQHSGVEFSFDKSKEKELFWPQDEDIFKSKHPSINDGFIYDEPLENGKFKRHLLTEDLSNFMIDAFSVKTFDNNYSYIFNGKYYDIYKDNQVRNLIQNFVAKGLKPSSIDQFYKDILIRSQVFGKKPFREPGKINLLNGIFDINSMELIPHTKKMFFTNAVNVNYEKEAKCPKWIDFLNDVFSYDQELIDALQMIFGYVIMGGERFLHKAFVFYGSGRNGKGVVLNMLKTILGNGSYSAVGMDLLDKPFSLVSLDGSLANISDETPSSINSAMFKKIVAGEDVQAAHKGKDEYIFQAKCVMIFACNDFPYFDDKNISILDRLFIIPFKKTYEEGSNRDPDKFMKLAVEASGVFNWAIEGAKKVLAERYIKPPREVSILKNEYREETDSVYSWFKDCVEIVEPSKDNAMLTTDIYEKFKAWSSLNGVGILSFPKFSKRLSRLVGANDQNRKYPTKVTVLKVDGKGYENLKIKVSNDKMF